MDHIGTLSYGIIYVFCHIFNTSLVKKSIDLILFQIYHAVFLLFPLKDLLLYSQAGLVRLTCFSFFTSGTCASFCCVPKNNIETVLVWNTDIMTERKTIQEGDYVVFKRDDHSKVFQICKKK